MYLNLRSEPLRSSRGNKYRYKHKYKYKYLDLRSEPLRSSRGNKWKYKYKYLNLRSEPLRSSRGNSRTSSSARWRWLHSWTCLQRWWWVIYHLFFSVISFYLFSFVFITVNFHPVCNADGELFIITFLFLFDIFVIRCLLWGLYLFPLLKIIFWWLQLWAPLHNWLGYICHLF